MFYCKDVKYDMCELKKKKIMIRKIKYAKNLNGWIFFFPSVMSSVSPHLSCFGAAEKRKTSRSVCCRARSQNAGWLQGKTSFSNER